MRGNLAAWLTIGLGVVLGVRLDAGLGGFVAGWAVAVLVVGSGWVLAAGVGGDERRRAGR